MSILDKRAMKRFSLALPTRLTQIGETDMEPFELFTKNICAGGAFFNIDRPLKIGTKVKLELRLSVIGHSKLISNQSLVKVTGAVIRNSHNGMAIGFSKNHAISPFPN